MITPLQRKTIANMAKIIKADTFILRDMQQSAKLRAVHVRTRYDEDSFQLDGAVEIRSLNYEIFAYTPEVIHLIDKRNGSMPISYKYKEGIRC